MGVIDLVSADFGGCINKIKKKATGIVTGVYLTAQPVMLSQDTKS